MHDLAVRVCPNTKTVLKNVDLFVSSHDTLCELEKNYTTTKNFKSGISILGSDAPDGRTFAYTDSPPFALNTFMWFSSFER